MKISAKVRFINNLKHHQQETEADGAWHVPVGTTIQEIVERSGVEQGGWEFAYTVNGNAKLRDYALEENDELVFMSPFIGG